MTVKGWEDIIERTPVLGLSMPQCGCFHRYSLKNNGPSTYELSVESEGQVDLSIVLENSGLARCVSSARSWLTSETTLGLVGVGNEAELRKFLDLLTSVLLVHLQDVDESYALGPYSVFDDDVRHSSSVGGMLNAAKYKGSLLAREALGERLVDFVRAHPLLANVECILPAPKSDPSTPDLPLQWADTLVSRLDRELVRATKTRQTSPQKERAEDESESEAVAKMAGSMELSVSLDGKAVLVLDDTIRSGGTIIELGRAARVAGAYAVFAVSIAKDAKFTLGGLNLSQEQWS